MDGSPSGGGERMLPGDVGQPPRNGLTADVVNLPLVAAAVVVFAADVVSHSAATWAGTVLAAVLVWRARLDVVLPLLLLYLSPTDLHWPGAGVASAAVAPVLGMSRVSIAGIPVSATLAVTFAVPARFVWDLVGLQTRYPTRERLLAWVWIAGLPLVVYATYLSLAARPENWSRPIRWYCIVTALPYGIALARRGGSAAAEVVRSAFLPVAVGTAALGAVGMYFSHFFFYVMGLFAVMAFHPWKGKSAPGMLLSVGFLIACIMVGRAGTFTMKGILIAGVTFGLLASLRWGRRLFSQLTLVLVLSVIVGLTGWSVYRVRHEGLVSLRRESTAPWLLRLQFKLLGDRASLWAPAIEQILRGPHFIVPTGRPIPTLGGRLGVRAWSVGVHNALLESLRIGGILVGGIILCFVFNALSRSFEVARRSVAPDFRVLALASSAVLLVGMFTGDFVLDFFVGFWVLGVAGIAFGGWSALEDGPRMAS